MSIPDIHPQIPFNPENSNEFSTLCADDLQNTDNQLYEIKHPFRLAEIVPPKKLSKNEYAEFEMLYKQMVNEFEKHSAYKNKIFGRIIIQIKICSFWVNLLVAQVTNFRQQRRIRRL